MGASMGHGRRVLVWWKEMHRRSVAVVFLLPLLSACAMWQPPPTLEEMKKNLDCLEAQAGLPWQEVSTRFGTPDGDPLPQPEGGLSRNARVYRDKHIIFYTESQRFGEAGRPQFREVVTKVEICRQR